MNAEWLLSWWNLIYVLPFGLALLYLAIYMVSGISFGEADADVDADVDADLDADAGIDTDADLDADADVDADVDTDLDADVDADADVDHDIAGAHDVDSDADHDAGHEAANETSTFWQAMHLLGVGSVPVSMVIMFMLLTWGGIGFVANQVARTKVSEPWMVAVASLPIAAFGSLLITSLLTRLMGKYMPMRETYARRFHELLGSTGEAIYPIDEKFGMVNIRDDHGDLFQVACRLRPGTPTIAKGSPVQLVAYSAKERMYYVIPPAQQRNGGAQLKTQ